MITRFFFDVSVLGHPARSLRRGTGLILFIAIAGLWPDFAELYGPDGVVPQHLLDSIAPPAGMSYPAMVARLHTITGWPYPVWLHGTVIGYLALCLLLAFSKHGRAAALLLLLLHGLLFTTQPIYSYGFDFLGSVALTYCFLFPQNGAHPWTGPWLRVLQLHVCMVYFFSGITKAVGHTWRNGEALYKALGLPAVPPLLPMDGLIALLGNYPTIFVLGGWAVILLELAYPLAIWHRLTGRIWLCGIVLMHVGIALAIGLYHFSALMILFNCIAFLPQLFPGKSTKAFSRWPSLHWGNA